MVVAARIYTDLAPWWPLISAPDEYAEEAAEAPATSRQRAGRCARCSSSAAVVATTPCT